VSDPAIRNAAGVVFGPSGEALLRHGDEEIRFAQEPFPLYPGEKLSSAGIVPLQVVSADCALRLRAIRDIVLDDVKRVAGDEWMFNGPGTYIPNVAVQVVEVVKSIIVHENSALKLRARLAFVDRANHRHEAGEEWLWRSTGAFLPDVHEEVLGVVHAHVLTDKKAVHLKALATFKDAFGKRRAAGDEWLVTIDQAPTHIPDVHEKVVGEVSITTLTNRQYAVIRDPIVNNVQHFGQKVLRKGECSFFLNPGERLESGIQNVIVLGEEEALLLTATEDFKDGNVERKAGHRWMVYGASDYIPPIEVNILEKRKMIPLDMNEGIYIRNLKSGKVSSVVGASYMLKPDEELYVKRLPPTVESLLEKQGREDAATEFRARDPTRLVTYRAPHNSAVQVYDYKRHAARVVFGPELVMLAPEEEFTVLSLSGGVPKQASKIRSLALLLGPDFMTDVIIVETSDHARLSLKLSYNWHFEVGTPDDADAAAMLFSVPDFTGDTCKAVGSLIRAAVASTTFDDFHKHSATIIRAAVFGRDDAGGIMDKLVFSANRLVITNIDIQSVEPVDQRTRDALQKSVQLAIEITTKSQEATARHEAERLEQEARGKLERQKIKDEAEAEKSRKDLVQLQAHSAAVESTGQATAEAKARAEAAYIEGEASVRQAELKANASTIAAQAELAQIVARQEAEISHAKALHALELVKAKRLAEIECSKLEEILAAVGSETLVAMSAGAESARADLIQSLNLSSIIVTDSSAPLNLFGVADSLIGNQ
jgi:major vault protein